MKNKRHSFFQVSQVFSLPSIDGFTLYKEKNKQSPVARTPNKSNFKHGDMIYLAPERDNLFPTDVTSSPHVPLVFKTDTPTNGSSSYASPKIGSFQTNNTGRLVLNSDVKEDDVDTQLEKLDGRIARKRDAQL